MKNIQKKILIVEDEQAISNLLKNKLERSGYQVFQALNGAQGLSMVWKEHPDLILLDVIMPIMDGMTMLKKLREDERGKEVPVIMLTNSADNDKVSNSVQFGVYDYLVKSNWTLEDVVGLVKTKISVRQKPSNFSTRPN